MIAEESRSSVSSDDLMRHAAMNVCQAKVTACEAVG